MNIETYFCLKIFREIVLEWYSRNARGFPWRERSDPFYVLIAEVLLRQTQAERVAGCYIDFLSKYPNAISLAKANRLELREWFRPLGLVKRADDLIAMAGIILGVHGGKVPDSLASLKEFPGVGNYIAMAVLVMSFGHALPMVDESTGRLIQRVLGIHISGTCSSSQQLIKIATSLVPINQPKEYNLALLDIANAYCKPKNPRCLSCPVSEVCQYAAGSPN